MTPADFIQFGALGIVAFVLIYFVKWLTTKFNGSIADNTSAIRQNTQAVEQVAAWNRDFQRSFDEIRRAHEEGYVKLIEAIEAANEDTLNRLWNLVKRENAKFEKGEGK